MHQNAFLIKLLKAAIAQDAMRNCGRVDVTIEDITNYLATARALYSSNDTFLIGKTFAERVRRRVWSRANFNFSEEILDMMCQSVKCLGTYNSWEEFRSAYSFDPYTILSDTHFGEIPYSQLPIYFQQQIDVQVASIISKINNTEYGSILASMAASMNTLIELTRRSDSE